MTMIRYLEELLEKSAKVAKKNMCETWFDGGYNSNKNIALTHVKFGLRSHYHIDVDWRKNVIYEHSFG